MSGLQMHLPHCVVFQKTYHPNLTTNKVTPLKMYFNVNNAYGKGKCKCAFILFLSYKDRHTSALQFKNADEALILQIMQRGMEKCSISANCGVSSKQREYLSSFEYQRTSLEDGDDDDNDAFIQFWLRNMDLACLLFLPPLPSSFLRQA